jgi:hypothetical protein
MIKVRVSEETPNLSHPSNLISAVRLENSSPSLMRLIKASGRTHSWVRRKSLGERNLGERPRGQEALGEMPRADAKSKKKQQQILLREQEILGEMKRRRDLVERARDSSW